MPVLPDPTTLVRPIVADGAMGSALFSAGMPVGEAPEAWLLTPEGGAAVEEVHRGHLAAGSGLILTCTFGANRLRLVGSEVEGRTAEVTRAAVAAARAAAGPARLVAGSMGPTGGLLVPYGVLDAGEVRAAFAEEAAVMAEAGVDVLWVETMMDLNEAIAAVDGARDGAPGLPVIATLVFAQRNRTMFGNPAEQAAALLAAAPGLHIVAKANAGIPYGTADGSTTYPGTPAEAAAYARRVADAGATIIGGCCGTTSVHVAAIAAELAR